MKRVLRIISISVLLVSILFTLISPVLTLAKEAGFVKVGVLMPLSGGMLPGALAS